MGSSRRSVAVSQAGRPAAVERPRLVAEIGTRHWVRTVSWGHASDGNMHVNFLVDPTDAAQLERAEVAAGEVFELAVGLGGAISGEHGIGWLKRGRLELQWGGPERHLHAAVKRAFDPENLLNPGRKI